MNNKLKGTIAFLMSLFLLSGCGEKPLEPSEPTPAPTEEPKKIENFYTGYKDIKTRPVAVMIDNDNGDARPHAGIDEAYLVYEVTVEGAATRLMALFSDTDTKKIGPVRSSRHYFLDYALEHDAIYTHFGWSPKAQNDIPALGVNNINGLFDDAFWREEKYKGDYHSAFTSMEKIDSKIKSKKYRTENKKTPLNYADENYKLSGEVANSVTIPYAGFYKVEYKYNKENSSYDRYINGSQHPIQNNGKIEAKNIIIMQMPHASLGDGSARINISNVGSGKGYFITDGKYIPITWSKPSRGDKTTFKGEDGNEVQLNHGQTWIQIVSSSHSVEIK